MDDAWSTYVRALTGSEPQEAVGRRVGLDGSTISRWRNGSRPGKPAEVAALALAYGGNVLEAFVAAGFLTPEQAGVPPRARPDWSTVTNEELLAVVAARLGAPLSAAPGRPALAAHEDGSITEEQEARNVP